MNLLMRFRLNEPEVISENVDEEVIIISFDSGNYYSLNKVGADIWKFIKNGPTVGEVVQRIISRYNGSHRDIENSVKQFMAELEKENLVVADDLKKPENYIADDTGIESNGVRVDINFEAPILHKYTDMADLLLLDPIHQTDDTGWPSMIEDPAHKDNNSDN